jgi:hypothetical protein
MANLPSGGIAPVQAGWSALVCGSPHQRRGGDSMCSLVSKMVHLPRPRAREECH